MTWTPLVSDPEQRATIVQIVRDLVMAVDGVVDQAAPSDLHVDRALLHVYTEELTGSSDGAELVVAAVEALRQTQRVGLFGGISKIGWLVAHTGEGDDADEITGAICKRLLVELERWDGSYDLIGGVVGMGVFALECGERGEPLARAVLSYLQHTACQRRVGMAWPTPSTQLYGERATQFPTGVYDVGLAHGAAGPVALLARLVARGIDEARPLLVEAADHLVAIAGRGDGFPSFFDVRDAEETRPVGYARRTAWCYGGLGVAAALSAAARVVRRDDWRSTALSLARAAGRPLDARSRVDDASICHGASGAALLCARIADQLDEPSLRELASGWLATTLAMRSTQPLAGFPMREDAGDGTPVRLPLPNLLVGAAGVALVLTAAISDYDPSWDRLLLTDELARV